QRQTTARTLLESGRANLKAKQFDAAVAALTEALRLNPADPGTQAALKDAEKARDATRIDAQAQAEAKKRLTENQKWLEEGRVALGAGRQDSAIRSFREAQKLIPGDQASAALQKDAERARDAAAAAVAAEAKKRQEEMQRQAEAQKALAQAREALA